QEMPTPAEFAPSAPSRTPRRAALRDSGGGRLSGPPVELLRQGEGGDDLPPPSELAKRIQVGLAIPAAQASAGRVRLPPLPPPPARSRRGLLATALLAVGALVAWNFYQSHQAKARAAAAQVQAPPAALPGFASVVTDPPQAHVYLGGREVGLTPMDILAIPATPQELRVEKKGYRPWRGRFGPENPLPAVITLEPQG
ncbi:MAG TPA: PEGA domain-containing protein, partial [Holophagaceae bacterium]|nr:PEGA domain-containing protein [Holophagaceae bacterium]